MFRTILVIGNIAAACGAATCALAHLMALTGANPVPGPWLAATVLAIFPLGGLAVFVGVRVGYTYRVWGHAQWPLLRERLPKWLTRAATGTFLYSAIRFVAFA